MKKQEKEILERFENAKNEYKEAKIKRDEVFGKKVIKKLNKKYAGKYFKSKRYDTYFFIKKFSNEDQLICDIVMIDKDCVTVEFDYSEYIGMLNIKKSNKLEFTNALNVVMDRLFNLKKLMI